MESQQGSTNTYTARARHPVTQQIQAVQLDKGSSPHDVLLKLLRALELRQFSEDDMTLVVGASPSFEGAIVPANTKLDQTPHFFKPDHDILELHMKPQHARIILLVDGAAVETKKILVDFTSRLCDVLTLFKHCLPRMNPNEDYAIQFSTKEGSPFLNSNQSLQMLGFDPVKDVISLVLVKSIAKSHWQRFGTISKRGWIHIGHGNDVGSVEKQSRKYAVLIEHFLVLFKKEGDIASQAIGLDTHLLKRRKDEKGQIYLTLTRLHPEKELKERLQSVSASNYASASGSSAAAKMLKNKAIGMVQGLRAVSKNVWVITGDDVGTPESLDIWFQEMSAKCANTGARRLFGIPLEETLALKNKRMNHIPPIVAKIVSYLDHKLETEGLFRLQGSHALVDQYRDKFEIGEEFDLNECLDAHVPATIMKQFFRELPEPLLLFSNYDALIAIGGNKQLTSEQKRDQVFPLLKDTLPPLNMGVLLFLLGFLSRVNRMSELNKMGLANIGTVFGPNLIRDEEDNPMLLLNNTVALNEIIQVLIQYEHDLASFMGSFNPLAGVANKWGVPHSTRSDTVTAYSNPAFLPSSSNPFPAPTSSPNLASPQQGANRPVTQRPLPPASIVENLALQSSGGSTGGVVSAAITHASAASPPPPPPHPGIGKSPNPGLPSSASSSPSLSLLSSAGANPTYTGNSFTPNLVPLPSAAPAKKSRPKGGHYASIAPLPNGLAWEPVSSGANSDSTLSVSTGSLSDSTDDSDTAAQARTASAGGLKVGTAPIGGVSTPFTRMGPHFPNAHPGVTHSASAQGLVRLPIATSPSSNPQPNRSIATPPSGLKSRGESPSFSVYVPQHNSDSTATTGPLSPTGGPGPLSPRGVAAPPPLELKAGPATFSPINTKDSYSKQLEEQVQSQKVRISELEAEVRRLQQLLRNNGISQ